MSEKLTRRALDYASESRMTQNRPVFHRKCGDGLSIPLGRSKIPLNRSRKRRFRLKRRAPQDKESNRAIAAPDAHRDSFVNCTKNAA